MANQKLWYPDFSPTAKSIPHFNNVSYCPWNALFCRLNFAWAKNWITSAEASCHQERLVKMEHRSKSVIDLESIVVYVGTTEGIIVDIRVISLHRCPSDRGIRKVWLQRAKLVRMEFIRVYTKHSYVCSAHFVSGSGPSKPNHLLPSVFPNKVFKTNLFSPMQLIYIIYIIFYWKFQAATDFL